MQRYTSSRGPFGRVYIGFGSSALPVVGWETSLIADSITLNFKSRALLQRPGLLQCHYGLLECPLCLQCHYGLFLITHGIFTHIHGHSSKFTICTGPTCHPSYLVTWVTRGTLRSFERCCRRYFPRPRRQLRPSEVRLGRLPWTFCLLWPTKFL